MMGKAAVYAMFKWLFCSGEISLVAGYTLHNAKNDVKAQQAYWLGGQFTPSETALRCHTTTDRYP